MNIRIVYIKASLIFSLLLNASSTAKGQDNNLNFIKEVIKKYNQHSSISYTIEYSIKMFDYDEPAKVKSKCQLIRNRKDSIFGGIILYNAIDTLNNQILYEKYYDLKSIWYIDPNKKEITKLDAHKGQTGTISSYFDGEVIRTYFLKPDNLYNLINDSNNIVKLKDTTIKTVSYLSIKIKFPKYDDISNGIKTILINRNTKNIEKIYYSVNSKDQIQINSWEISNIKFDGFDSSNLSKKLNSYKSTYSVTDYVEPNEEPLKINTISPDFSGKKYPELKELNNKEFIGKIVILDFWYMACGPCAKAIPSLNNIYQKYKNNIVILGLNPYDSDSISLKKMPTFIQRNNVTYPIVFISDSVVQTFNISGFPTLYVIDKSGVIRYTQEGYLEQTEMKLEEIISNLIKE